MTTHAITSEDLGTVVSSLMDIECLLMAIEELADAEMNTPEVKTELLKAIAQRGRALKDAATVALPGKGDLP